MCFVIMEQVRQLAGWADNSEFEEELAKKDQLLHHGECADGSVAAA